MGPAVHGMKPNDLLQLDYIEIVQSPSGFRYLILPDDLSDKT